MTADKTVHIPTIYDVAREAGVARATVDRVIYKRGGVAESTISRVNEVIERLGYTANPNASRLASKKNLTIACLIPQFEEGEYWSVAYKGFVDGARSIKTYDVRTDIHLFDPDNIESFRAKGREIIDSKPAGVITNVVFADAVREFAAELDEAGIPYAFVDQKISDLNYTVYFGADPSEAGVLGAFLLTHRMEVNDIAMIRIIRDANHMADPNRVRRNGFIDYIKENYPGCRIHTLFIPPHNPPQTYKTLQIFFSEHPEIKHIGMTNSRVWLIDEFLEKYPDDKRIVVGFDDLKRNLESLKKGNVEYLVTRHISLQSYKVMTQFAECVIKGARPVHRNNYVHMDILHKKNLDDY